MLEEKIDVVLISGDVYDTTLAIKEAIILFNDTMHMLCMELKKQVIVIAGNHDFATHLVSCASLLAPMGLHIIGKIEENLSKPGCHIGLAHTFLVGMTTCDSEHYIEVGGSEAMDASMFHHFDYVAMGIFASYAESGKARCI